MSTVEAQVAILMPKTNPDEYDRVFTRYEGLVVALADMSVESFFAYQAASYDPATKDFKDPSETYHYSLGDRARASVVRDLTVQVSYDKPLYTSSGLAIINNPRASELIKGGLRLTRLQQLGIEKISKEQPSSVELIDPEKFRMLSIGGRIVGAAEYTDSVPAPGEKASTRKDYLAFIDPADLTEDMDTVARNVHAELEREAGTDQNILVIDLIEGVDSDGLMHSQVSIPPKALRISKWDERFPSTSKETVVKMAGIWDQAEAALLAEAVTNDRARRTGQ